MIKANLYTPLRCALLFTVTTLVACAQSPSAPAQYAAKKSCSKATRCVQEERVVGAALDRDFVQTRPAKQAAPGFNSLWERIGTQLQFDELGSHEAVEDMEDWYASHNYYLTKISQRAIPYMHYILHAVEQRDMPIDLALLPFVESAFDPFAYSHGRAAGLWQFVPNTAEHMNIPIDWWYDGRRDVIVSTNAALDYLQELNARFDGDWLLTLAAYNAGGGRVNRAITHNRKAGRPTDFWSLRLPRETKRYIPKLLALVKVFRNPASYNITLPDAPDEPYFALVKTGGQLSLSQAAKLADTTVDELYKLNPALNRSTTAPNGPHNLLVPVAKAKRFNHQLAKLSPDQRRVIGGIYTVKPGDTLISIARKHHIDLATLRATNKLKGDFLKAGQTLSIPMGEQQSDALNRGVAAADREKRLYTVRRGDNLSKIANQFDVSTRDLLRWNRLSARDIIHPGDQLTVWINSASGRDMTRKVGYTVRNGDSLWAIARRFKVDVADILEWNSITSRNHLRPGQSLTLFVDITTADL
ncbi:LysM peptidoglycan-binding domain-containing protein [Spongiibacter nanhainus]|uniref:LysM peptidoglycan-binding domain-containing protein n=1 Tax=Spongiibacter nanhainus TaxID=2794344 RepID=A0A7T4R3T0_9GAMM|nr:LysM peptidoglycan-binding domain-containing protein [Spongiibacter nanhainus]QQD19921.1 LysM peptidoglycan-binding domain-containing protein [Spongiibacter nanhainus]